ncbi:HIRAN domain-containing protein [Azospirillum sp. Sh1]|uniref:HIRAN domain-containing protein n=1 Tax=Azospirillum sp. Sh1 TaxID=2607285 RepID=UPI00165E19EE|nr:HIRAN domain-containing protein [Azospirillum sp. Sh1]
MTAHQLAALAAAAAAQHAERPVGDLLHLHLAGGAYHDLGRLEKKGTLPGAWEPLTLRRAPTNPYDGNAVEVWWSAGPWMLGHIPCEDAEHLAPLMDARVVPRCWAYGGKKNGRALWWRERLLIDLPTGTTRPFRRENDYQERAVEALWEVYPSHLWPRNAWLLDEALSAEAEHAFTRVRRERTRERVVLERYARWWRSVDPESVRRYRTANAVRDNADVRE